MGNKRTSRILVVKPEEKILLWGPRQRREDNIT
jgi:hypothetical protein